VRLDRLWLTDFRSYAAVEIDFAPGLTAILGANGQGKTNLIEAVVYLSTLSSHRVATDAPLIRHGAERALIRADVHRDDRSLQIEVEITAGRANKARINKSPVPRTREILGILRTVVFAPEDLALVKGDPSERRRFLDDLLVQRLPRLAGTRGDYDRVLKQRNALLKSAGAARRSNPDEVARTLEVWDDQVAALGAELTVARCDLVERLRPRVASAYTELIDSGETVGLTYATSVEGLPTDDVTAAKEALLAAMIDRRREELDRGVTLVGPHRDDLLLALGPVPVKGYASHGESWSAALALRLASYDLLTEESAAPVLVLDDVFAELDASRRAHLAERVASAPQVLITAAVAEDVPAALTGTRYDVTNGEVQRHG